MQLTRNLYQHIFRLLWHILAYDCRSASGVFPDVNPMSTNPKLQLEFLLQWISHDHWHQGNFILHSPQSSLAIFPPWICKLHQMPDPLLSNIVELGNEKKGPTSCMLWMTSYFWHLLLLNLQLPQMLDLLANSIIKLGNEKKGLTLNGLWITTHNLLLLLHKLNIQMPDPSLSNVVELRNKREQSCIRQTEDSATPATWAATMQARSIAQQHHQAQEQLWLIMPWYCFDVCVHTYRPWERCAKLSSTGWKI